MDWRQKRNLTGVRYLLALQCPLVLTSFFYLLGGEKRQALKVFRSGGIDVDGVFCQLVQHVLIFLPRLILKVLHIAQLIQILLPRCRSSYLLLSQDHDRHQTYEQKPNCPLRHLFGLLG